MRFLELEVTNWGPHVHQLLQFDPDAKVIAIAGPNDVGKSWIIRALAGTFVTGQNEYYNKGAILDDTNQAQTRTKFLGRGKVIHEVKKTFNRKGSEGDDEIYLNGEKISPTKYVEFLCEEFQVTDPKILLALAVSMQGETHFYLKAKKREREEGLRSLRQYNRIDGWKENLSKLLTQEDKNLTEQKNTLLGKKATLEEQQKDSAKRIEELEKELVELCSGTTPEGKKWILDEQIQAWETWEKTKAEIELVNQEIQTLQTNLTLFQEALGRLQMEKEKSPLKGLTQEEIQTKETELEDLEKAYREALSWKRFQSEEKTKSDLEAAIGKLEKEIQDIQIPLSQEQEKELIQARDDYAFAHKDLERLPTSFQTPEEANTAKQEVQRLKAEEEKQETLQKKAQEEILKVNRSKRLISANLEEAEVLTKPEYPVEKIEEVIQERIKELRDELTSKKISKEEANLLKQRILANWPENAGAVPCPICEEDLSKIDAFQDETARTALQKRLQSELSEQSQGGTQELPGGKDLQMLILLENLLKTDIPFLKETEEQSTKLLNELEGKPTPKELRTQWEKLQTRLKDWENHVAAQAALKTKEEDLSKKVGDTKGNKPEEQATQLIETTRTQRELKKSKTESLSSKKEQKIESDERFEKAKTACTEKTPQIRIILTEDEPEIHKQHAETTTNLQTFRRDKNALAPTLEKILRETSKIKDTEKVLAEKKTHQSKIKSKTPWETGLIHPEDKLDENEAGAIWSKKKKRTEDVTALLKEQKPKQEEIETRIKTTTVEIEDVCKETANIEAGLEVADFLDYKNAPRQLLAMTVDQIFHRANRIARSFNLDMALTQGKNLKFNVVQSRNGKSYTQETERLGFGKANVLGVCCRLGAQETLAPDTGFLILDEPCAYVDIARKNAMADFLKKLGEIKEEQAPQIILVSHEEAHTAVANQVLQIG